MRAEAATVIMGLAFASASLMSAMLMSRSTRARRATVAARREPSHARSRREDRLLRLLSEYAVTALAEVRDSSHREQLEVVFATAGLNGAEGSRRRAQLEFVFPSNSDHVLISRQFASRAAGVPDGAFAKLLELRLVSPHDYWVGRTFWSARSSENRDLDRFALPDLVDARIMWEVASRLGELNPQAAVRAVRAARGLREAGVEIVVASFDVDGRLVSTFGWDADERLHSAAAARRAVEDYERSHRRLSDRVAELERRLWELEGGEVGRQSE